MKRVARAARNAHPNPVRPPVGASYNDLSTGSLVAA